MSNLFKIIHRKTASVYAITLLVLASIPVVFYMFSALRAGTPLLLVSLTQVLLIGWLWFLLRYTFFAPLKSGQEFLQDNTLKQTVHPEVLSLHQKNTRLAEEVNRATAYVKAIENPDIDIAQIYTDDQDQSELKISLLGLREHLQKLEAEEKQRGWVTQGLAQFIEILRSHTEDMNQLGDRIITHLVKYLGAIQGGIFILNQEEDESHLEMLSCYAYERKKYLQKRVEIGEGLLGQAILEKDYILLTEIPEQYVSITSGLGGANPRVLLIFPLITNDEVLGAIELASFQSIESHHIEFMKKLSENIASTLSNVKNAQNNRRLLEESQQQTEEMRAQEEEMRQNMEELQATQEQQDRLQAEIKANEAALQKKVQELEEARAQMEEVKAIEQQRAKEQIEKRNNMMTKVQEKFKAREQELLAQIQQLEEASTDSTDIH